MLIIFAGLPGSGKSTLARVIADRLDGTLLDKDLVRHEMFGASGITFTTEQDDIVVDEMLDRASALLRGNPSKRVLLDGRVFSRNSQLKHVTEFAELVPTRWVVIECICSEATAKRRLAADMGRHIAANRTPDLYDQVRARFEPIPEPKIVIDTDEPVTTCVEHFIRELVHN
jgi:adenylylsulfate kinase